MAKVEIFWVLELHVSELCDLVGASCSLSHRRPYFEERYRCNQQLLVSEIPACLTHPISVVLSLSRNFFCYHMAIHSLSLPLSLSLSPPLPLPANEAAHRGPGAARG